MTIKQLAGALMISMAMLLASCGGGGGYNDETFASEVWDNATWDNVTWGP